MATVGNVKKLDRDERKLKFANDSVSLSLAVELNWEDAIDSVDNQRSYFGANMRNVAPPPHKCRNIAFANRVDRWRIIILRRAKPARLTGMSKKSTRPIIIMPSCEDGRAITAAAEANPDAMPLTLKQLRGMVPMRSLRGRPKSTGEV